MLCEPWNYRLADKIFEKGLASTCNLTCLNTWEIFFLSKSVLNTQYNEIIYILIIEWCSIIQNIQHHFPSSPCIRSLACWDTFLQGSPSNEKSPCLIFFMISSALVWVRLFSWHWKGTCPDSMVYCKHRKNKDCWEKYCLNIINPNLNISKVSVAQETCLLVTSCTTVGK